MIITFINKTPSCGKTSLCIALANYLNDIQTVDSKDVIIFDCDPKLTCFTKYDTFVKKYPKPPTNYQVVALPLDEDSFIYRILNDIKDKDSYFLFDIPSSIDEWLCIRILVSSNIIVIPFQPSKKEMPQNHDFFEYLYKQRECLTKIKIPVKSRIVLTPVNLEDEDSEKIELKDNIDFLLSPTIEKHEKVLDALNPIDMTEFENLPFKEFSEYIVSLINEISQPKEQPTNESGDNSTDNNQL